MSMTNTHTTACGTEPFDKNYCIGYQVHHEDWITIPACQSPGAQTFLDGNVLDRYREIETGYRNLSEI